MPVIHVYQYTHPVTGARVRFRGTRAECDEHRAKVREARRRLRNGADARAVADEFDDRAQLTLAEAFTEYLATASDARAQQKADQFWRCTINTPTGEGARLLGSYRVCELNERVMARWGFLLATTGGPRGEGRAPATIKLALDYISAAVRRAGIEPPWQGWRPKDKRNLAPKRPWLRSLDELERLLRSVQEDDQRAWSRGRYSAHWYCVAFAALTGLRNAELAGLAWDCVELDHGPPRIVVRYQAPKGWRLERGAGARPLVAPKNGHILHQVLHPTAARVLSLQREQLQARKWWREDGPVWPDQRGRWRSNGQALSPTMLRRWVRATGLPAASEWVPHSLRHSFCSLEVAAHGGDLAAAARRTGHRDLRALLIYVHELGSGLGASPVPALNLGEDVPALPPPSSEPRLPPSAAVVQPELLPPPPPPLDAGWDAHATAEREARQKVERVRREQASRPFSELAAEWLAMSRGQRLGANGVELERPPAVTEAARRNGATAYARVRRGAEATGELEAKWRPRASSARLNARRATLAAWARALKQARKA